MQLDLLIGSALIHSEISQSWNLAESYGYRLRPFLRCHDNCRLHMRPQPRQKLASNCAQQKTAHDFIQQSFLTKCKSLYILARLNRLDEGNINILLAIFEVLPKHFDLKKSCQGDIHQRNTVY